MGDAVAIIKGEGKNLRRKEKRARIEQIRASLGLSDSQRTPMVHYYIFFFFGFLSLQKSELKVMHYFHLDGC